MSENVQLALKHSNCGNPAFFFKRPPVAGELVTIDMCYYTDFSLQMIPGASMVCQSCKGSLLYQNLGSQYLMEIAENEEEKGVK